MGTYEESKEEELENNGSGNDIKFDIETRPPWYTCILLALQHYITMFVASLSVPFVLSGAICMGEDNVGKAELIGTLFVACGIITLIQVLFGARLPIVQAGTFALLSPTLSFLNLPKFECPNLVLDDGNVTLDNTSVIIGSPEHREIWQERLCVIQGSIMIAALFEIVLGFSGAIGFMMRFIGPLSIAPTVSLLGISLFRSAADYASVQWGITAMTLVFMVVFSQYLSVINIPCCLYEKGSGCVRKKGYPAFKMFPIIIAIFLAWFISFILTITNALPDDPTNPSYGGRTDARSDVLRKAPWIRFPYPGQWGKPTVDAALVCGLLAGLLASIVESVGDYFATARLAGAPSPPEHAVNRGIGIEGLGNVVAGAFGTGNGTTSTSINVGVIGLTKVGSRLVVLLTVPMLIGFGLINKIGALFVTIPDPIIGASFFILFGMIVAVGISNLQFVDLNSSRNLFIIGFSFFFGLTVSEWMKSNPDIIQTGSDVGDNIITVLLSTGMFLGGVMGFILDNTIRGTKEERGMLHSKVKQDPNATDAEEEERRERIYNVPLCGATIKRQNWSRYVPFCPGYGATSTNSVDVELSYDNGAINQSENCVDKEVENGHVGNGVLKQNGQCKTNIDSEQNNSYTFGDSMDNTQPPVVSKM